MYQAFNPSRVQAASESQTPIDLIIPTRARTGLIKGFSWVYIYIYMMKNHACVSVGIANCPFQWHVMLLSPVVILAVDNTKGFI